jgi:SAM-dependent methyltransferase
MREVIVSNFINSIYPYLNGIKKVAIVGGSRNEPEIIELEKSKKILVHTYGIDKENDFFLDLNVKSEIKDKYDLVLCSQVFEHIYDLKNAIANLASLLTRESLLWVACPASNRSHGSPNYYSAGYQPELIINLSRDFNLEVLHFGRLGSKRLYFMTHALRVWPNQKELRHPVLKYDFRRFSGSKPKNMLRFFRDFPGRLYASSLTSKVNDQVEFSTETFVLFKNRSA